MLAQSVVQEFKGQVRFAVENYGDSALARRFGVTRYPAIFADEVLVATPKDFGFYGKGEGGGEGRYSPVRSAASHERFRTDLARILRLLLAGDRAGAMAQAAEPDSADTRPLPAFSILDLAGSPLSRQDLEGRVVLMEFWATWCPPCRPTLTWLGELKQRYGDRVAIVALAVESDEGEVRKVASQLKLTLRWAMATPEVARSLGDVSVLPTLHVFDGRGGRVGTFYGATPDLHERAEAAVARALARQ